MGAESRVQGAKDSKKAPKEEERPDESLFNSQKIGQEIKRGGRLGDCSRAEMGGRLEEKRSGALLGKALKKGRGRGGTDPAQKKLPLG